MTTTALTSVPSNRNYLSPLNYKLAIKRCPGVDFFVQKTNIPGITTTATGQPTPFNKIPIAGDELKFEPLRMTFLVDEDLINWFEIQTWMRQLSLSENFERYKELVDKTHLSGYGIKSDISLIVLNSAKNPKAVITYKDAFPVGLTELEFDSNAGDVVYVKSTATFLYTLYDIEYVV